MAETLHLLHYAYVEGILDKRAPHRPGHLTTLERLRDDGRLVMAGAVGDPPTGGLFVFRDRAAIDELLATDPYVEAGLVTAHRTEPWTVVVA